MADKDCASCYGAGALAKNFGIDSPGVPEIVECFNCGGTGVASIHDLFQKLREHPDFVFGQIFVRDDLEGQGIDPDKFTASHVKWAEEAMVAAGFEFLDFGYAGE